jgi:NADH dehydrogenase FAD-containing subunit
MNQIKEEWLSQSVDIRNPQQTMSKDLKNIVIVGGGGAGVTCAKALSRTLDSSKYQLILINPLPYRIWLVATLRLIVTNDDALKKDVMLPYDKIFTNGNGKFVEGTVKTFEATKEGGSVILESGETIEYVDVNSPSSSLKINHKNI